MALLEEISKTLEEKHTPENLASDFSISRIDVNKNGKLVITGQHVRYFENEIIKIAKIAENVCCICGNYGEIKSMFNQYKIPLCDKHFQVANDTTQ
ncbi:hypothetical protein RYA05_06335 [Pseudomonas syringae pv. actinidiae]|nr:hypothetical protein [Pseudomonas syringae pv. actinidiae]